MALLAGTRLGPYEILAPLGAGGMGEVYRARDVRLEREVAVKVLPEHLSLDAAALSRFEREARAIAALAHPNILDIHDFGHESGVTFLVTELLEGETLRSRLAGVPMPWRTAREIGLAIAEGLASAHEHGIVHRDLKPENVFLTFDGRVKILDFGLARLEEAKPSSNLETSPTTPIATEMGTVMGTAGYMSPEQARGKTADGRSDIFSLGCILYETVTGRRAFAGGSVAEIFAAILREEPSDPGDLVKGLPDQVRLVILRCLSKYPESRFQSARDLAFALKVAGAEPDVTIAAHPGKARSTRTWLVAGAGSIVAALVAFGLYSWTHRPGPIDSLAVLPFGNASHDPNLDYLSDGITENLINDLSQLRQLRVPARSTAFAYRNEPDPRRFGKKMGVRVVLAGRIVRLSNDLVVQANLIDVGDGSQIWGNQFPVKLSNALAVQEAIAQKISQAARLKLTGEQERRLAKRDTESGEAYLLYLKGRYHWNRRSEEGMLKSIQLFDQAIQRDPNYARAFAGLADSYNLLAFYGWRSPREVLPKARENAVKALRIDDTIAEAHVTVADTSYLFDWDWETAEKGFRRAIVLNPNYPTAHQWYANYLTVLGRSSEAIEEILRARDLDPLDLIISTDVGLTYYYAGERQKALEQYGKALEVEPNFFLTHIYLGLIHLQSGDSSAAIGEFQTATKLDPDNPDAIAGLGYSYGAAGRKREAEQAFEHLRALSKKRYVSAFPIAFVYVGLNEKDKAFEWLERAYQERAGRLVYIAVEHAFDPLKADPRFAELLRRMNFRGASHAEAQAAR